MPRYIFLPATVFCHVAGNIKRDSHENTSEYEYLPSLEYSVQLHRKMLIMRLLKKYQRSPFELASTLLLIVLGF